MSRSDGDDDEGVTLLARWRAGDVRAGDAFYRRHSGPIKLYFRRRVSRTEDIADLVQETFVRCHRAAYRREGTIRAFLFGIANFLFLEYLRQLARGEQELRDHDELLTRAATDFTEDPVYVLEQMEDQRLLMKAMRRIQQRYQIVLELSRWEELTQAEIAMVLSGPETTVPAATIGRWKSEAVAALEEKMLELSVSPELREATTITIMTWRRWAVAEAQRYGARPAKGREGVA